MCFPSPAAVLKQFNWFSLKTSDSDNNKQMQLIMSGMKGRVVLERRLGEKAGVGRPASR